MICDITRSPNYSVSNCQLVVRNISRVNQVLSNHQFLSWINFGYLYSFVGFLLFQPNLLMVNFIIQYSLHLFIRLNIFFKEREDCLECLPELAPAIADCMAEYGSDGIAISVCVSEIMSPNVCYTQEIVCCVLETYFNIECQSK